jgi:DNA mismatch repair ATPase MutS
MQMMALAGLLSHLQSVQDNLQVADIRPSGATKMLLCDNITRHALSVFVSELHPGGGSRQKEGLSLLSLLNHAHTGPGRNIIKYGE